MAKNLINGYLMGLENKRRKNMKDLHLHTNISDGKNTPMEMINKLIELGVNEASITDHDAFDSYLVISKEADKKEKGKLIFGNLTVYTGIELDCIFGDKFIIEILGYGFDSEDKELKEYASNIQTQRKNRIKKYISAVNEKFGESTITEEEIFNDNCKTYLKPHIVHPLLDKKIFTEYKEANNFLKSVPNNDIERINARDAVKLIHKAGGKAFLAHPGVYDYEYDDIVNIINTLTNKGLDGIELNYPYAYVQSYKYDETKANELISSLERLFPEIEYSQGSDSHSIEQLKELHGLKNKWAVM